jgi:hypothetical protein
MLDGAVCRPCHPFLLDELQEALHDEKSGEKNGRKSDPVTGRLC